MSIIIILAYNLIPNRDLLELFPLWVLGVSIRLVPSNTFYKNKIFTFSAYLLTLLCIAYSNIHPSRISEYTVGLSISIIILQWQHSLQYVNQTLSKISHFFAEFSFTLYSTHFFLMFLLYEILKLFGLPIRIKEASLKN